MTSKELDRRQINSPVCLRKDLQAQRPGGDLLPSTRSSGPTWPRGPASRGAGPGEAGSPSLLGPCRPVHLLSTYRHLAFLKWTPRHGGRMSLTLRGAVGGGVPGPQLPWAQVRLWEPMDRMPSGQTDTPPRAFGTGEHRVSLLWVARPCLYPKRLRTGARGEVGSLGLRHLPGLQGQLPGLLCSPFWPR